MAGGLPETRKKPQIPIGTLFLFVVVGLVLRKKSFHQMDLWARTAPAKRLLGSSRGMVASDATLWRVLPTMAVGALREYLQRAYLKWKELVSAGLTLPSGRKLRVGIVDGSMFGRFYASCLQVKADRGNFFVDLEVGESKGKELPTTERLLCRVARRHGMRFVDIILADGLYITQKFLTRCRRLGLHVLVKTSEEGSLNILLDARSIFDSKEMADAVEHVTGVDADRNVAYEVWAAGGFRHTGYEGSLKVARVVERPLKPRKGRGASETFWVICTDESLSGADLRELAHRRWSVENNGFKMLNEQMNSKHIWTRGARSRQTFEVLMLCMFLSFGMLKAFEAALDEGQLWECWKLRKVTLGFLVGTWMTDVGLVEPLSLTG